MSWASDAFDWAKEAFSPTGGGTVALQTAGSVMGSIAAGNTTQNTGGVGIYNPHGTVNPYAQAYNQSYLPASTDNSELIKYGALAVGAVVLLKVLKVI